MSETSEEKTLPASEKKLKEARKKGQTPKSQDLVSGVIILTVFLWLAQSFAQQKIKVEALFNLVARRIWLEPFAQLWPQIHALAIEILMGVVLPLLALVVICVIATNVLTMRGFLFSVEPVKPDFEHINPVTGLKRIFSMRNVVEFLKSLFKIAALGTAFFIVIRTGLQGLFTAADCGGPCLGQSFEDLLYPLVIAAIVTFLAVGGVDVMLQNWLFRRDMKMSKSELKRERKDAEGDPLILQQRRKERRNLGAFSGRTGLRHASLMIGTGEGWVIGLRYRRGETPVPVVVCRARGEAAATMMADARKLGLPIFLDAALGDAIGRAARQGEPVPQAHFQKVADVLVAAKLI